MPLLTPRQAPPPDYYAEKLDFLLDEVARRNADLLAAGEWALIDGWRAAGIPARRLFARLLTRKGPWFRVDRLSYVEIPDLGHAIADLAELGLVTVNPPAPADALLNLFTRAELDRLFPCVRAGAKPAWIESCVTRYPDVAVRARLAPDHPWVALATQESVAVCHLLFFGSDRDDLSQFVLQDLGLLRFENYEVGPHTRPFASRTEIEQYRECRRLAALIATDVNDREAAAAVRRRLWWRTASRSVDRLRDQLLNRLGYLHERRGEFDEALECYGLAAAHPARERSARLLKRLGDEPGFAMLIEDALCAPCSAEEEDYALRCTAAAAGRNLALTITEIRLDPVRLDGCAGGSIERHALNVLADEDAIGWHLENHFPLGLAGLLFWEEMFAPVAGAFSHPLQHGPRDLFWPDFARVRAVPIAARLQHLEVPGALREQLIQVADRKRGITNRLVQWDLWTPALVAALADVEDPRWLLAVARHAIGDLNRSRTGFPDLTVIRPGGRLEFVEVKGPTDQLQPAQRTWLRTLTRLGLPARVLKFRA